MSTLTIRLPDDKHLRLRKLAKHRSLSVNKLIEELATISIAEFDAETRFRALAGGADAIVTNNVRDVRRGELAFPHLQILTPAQFLKTI